MRTQLSRIGIILPAAATAIVLGCEGGGTGPQTPEPGVATVVITPRGLTLPLGSRGQLTAIARNAAGADIGGAAIVWTSKDQTIASTSSDGEVSGNRVGQTQVIATVQGKSDTVLVAVIDGITLVVAPAVASVNVGGTQQFTVTARDGAGNTVPAPPVTWSSSAPTIATIDGTGLARGVTPGVTSITARAGTRTSQPAMLTVQNAAAGPCDGITSVDRFDGIIDYGFKAVGIQTESGTTIDADDKGYLEATMIRQSAGPILALWHGPITGTASVTQKRTSSSVTTLNGGGPVIPLTAGAVPQMSLVVDLAACTYQLRAIVVINTRLVEFGSTRDGPEIVSLVQFAGPLGAWRTAGGVVKPSGSLPPHSVAWGASNPNRDVLMPGGLAVTLFLASDAPVGQGTGSATVFRVQ